MKLLVTYPDAERLIVDHLSGLIPGATVAVGVPKDWTTGSAPHVQVALDGTPRVIHPLAQKATIRLTARCDFPTASKALANEALGQVLVGPWPEGITNVRPLTGPFPARDPQTLAELTSVTVQVTVRSTPLDGS